MFNVDKIEIIYDKKWKCYPDFIIKKIIQCNIIEPI